MFDLEILRSAAAIAGLFAVVGVAYWIVRRLRHDVVAANLDNSQELLDSLRAAYERGSMATEEYERARTLLTGGPPSPPAATDPGKAPGKGAPGSAGPALPLDLAGGADADG